MIYIFIITALLLIGCVSNTINMSSGSGKHELGPDDDSAWSSSKDSQQSTDSIQELSSKISGIDKSQNKIRREIQKTSDTQLQMQERDETIDRLNPALPKHQRKQMYKKKD